MSCFPYVPLLGLLLLFDLNTSSTLSMTSFVATFTKYFSPFIKNYCYLTATKKSLISKGLFYSSILWWKGSYLSSILWRNKIHISQILQSLARVGYYLEFYLAISVLYILARNYFLWQSTDAGILWNMIGENSFEKACDFVNRKAVILGQTISDDIQGYFEVLCI